jgi:hypothetical protein
MRKTITAAAIAGAMLAVTAGAASAAPYHPARHRRL